MMISDASGKASKVILPLVGAVCLILLMLYMGGFFTPDKIGPGDVSSTPKKYPEPQKTARASVEHIVEYYEAVGTVRPRTETRIESQITGRILNIPVRPGDRVQKGKLLIVLDSRELQSRVDQAKQGASSAKARRAQAKQGVRSARAILRQAESAYKRTKGFVEAEAATAQDLEKAESAYLQAKAGLKQAEDGLKEAEAGVRQAGKVIEQNQISLGYTRISAPEGGEVVKRLVEPGDLAWPGKPLVVLQTRGALRLEALIREGLIKGISPGSSFDVVVDALDIILKGTVEEIIPSADPQTRTFLVKVGLPRHEGLFPGMFGRLMVPVEKRKVVVVSKNAVRRIGQLEIVTVKENGQWQQIFVRTGKNIENDALEILSGLKGGEVLALRGSHEY
ncbi:MAG: efflux RND transporter periplasmic adaptor subunit [Deltaproteobacteria bacterium]|nr:efflux RND transporter periplasmic adaptor subunit [Deltaproteobacteria bacterium]